VENIPLAAHLRSLSHPVGAPTGDLPLTGPRGPEAETPAQPFSEHLSEQISRVNELQMEADQSIEDLVTGNSDDIHSTMIAVQKADVSFRLLMAVRNKLLDAYDEVMRMQV
jgi:flagellar hook-basal body complex protein FliE